ncbi:MAG: response regulator [SAR324 cluster bacterium]|nr:response regulator [SAR324 cluster bacterium]
MTGTHTCEEALEQAQRAITLKEPYSLTFVDLNLEQNLTGVDVAIHLKQLDPLIEIVIVTAYFDRQDKDYLHRMLGSGNFYVLQKPFKATAIKGLVDSLRLGPSVRLEQMRSPESVSQLET